MPGSARKHPPVCTCDTPLPEFVDRPTQAALISARFFPVTARTIRTWPLTVVHVNKKALHNVEEALAFAERKLANAPLAKR